MKKPFLLYLRSRLNVSLSLMGAALIALSLVFFRQNALVPALVVVLGWAVTTFLVFNSRKGASEVVAESDEDRRKKIREKIDAFARTRDRIAVLRIGDERMRKAVEYFLLVSGAYIEKCRGLESYSPPANERIERALEICQVFLGELDENSIENRYGVEDKKDLASPQEKYAEAIMECASVIKERTVRDLEGSSGAERLAIIKELEEDK